MMTTEIQPPESQMMSDTNQDMVVNQQHTADVVTTAQAKMPIKNYQDFYRFYLTEHHDLNCRRLHVVGSSLGLIAVATAFKTRKKRYVAYGLLAGYACAWVGHFGFEKNKPASFKQPLYSFISDWRMYGHILTGKISLTDQHNDTFDH